MAKQMSHIPVKNKQHIEMEIHGLSHEGVGVGRYEGFAIFVPGALPGERVRAEITRVQRSHAWARLNQILLPSADRQIPLCPLYQWCGGCHMQHLRYEAQLAFKRQLVVDALERIGKLFDVPVHPTLGMKKPWQYRNKSQVPVGMNRGRFVAGFYAPRSHDIIDMESCPIQHPLADEIVRVVKEELASLGIPPYDEIRHRGLIRHIVSRISFHTEETMLVLVTNDRHIPRQNQLIVRLRRRIPHLASIAQNINTAKTNVIFGEKTLTLWGKDAITDTIGDIRFLISPRSFYQVNPQQTKALYDKALAYANLTGKEQVIDAYCGIGTISLFLARQARHVYGVEVVPEAIADAKRNAALNGMTNVDFLLGQAEEVIPHLYRERGISADVVVVDPPRKGCDEALLQTMASMRPKRIVYVSCNPSTLARDLRYLEDHGYRTVEVQPVDMFPQTAHVECCSLLVRKNDD